MKRGFFFITWQQINGLSSIQRMASLSGNMALGVGRWVTISWHRNKSKLYRTASVKDDRLWDFKGICNKLSYKLQLYVNMSFVLFCFYISNLYILQMAHLTQNYLKDFCLFLSFLFLKIKVCKYWCKYGALHLEMQCWTSCS